MPAALLPARGVARGGAAPRTPRRHRASARRVAAAATGEDDAESRLELLERRTRFTPKPDGVPLVARDREGKLPAPKLPPWSERLAGKTAAEAAWEFWIGEEGVLWWASKVSYVGAGALVVGWVVFRFVGPALGLYSLKSGFADVGPS